MEKLINQFKSATSYQQLFNVHINNNELKIKYIKTKMNDQVGNINNFLIDKIITYYQFIKTDTENLNKLINIVNQYNIHPLILKNLLYTLVHSCFIIKLNNDISLRTNDQFTNLMLDIVPNIDIIFSIFDPIFDEADIKFKEIDELIGYNKINDIDKYELNNLYCTITNITCNTYITKSDSLNIFLKHLQDIINQDIINDDIMNFTENKFKKLNNLNDIINIYHAFIDKYKLLINEYYNLEKQRIKELELIGIDDINKLLLKDSIYQWILLIQLHNNYWCKKLIND